MLCYKNVKMDETFSCSSSKVLLMCWFSKLCVFKGPVVAKGIKNVFLSIIDIIYKQHAFLRQGNESVNKKRRTQMILYS